MKVKKQKLNQLLKTGILLLGVSLLLWNCNDYEIEHISQESNFYSVNKFQEIERVEVNNIVNNIASKAEKRKGGFKVTIDKKSLVYKKVKNTNLTIPTFNAFVKPHISSKVFLVKKQDSIYTCVYNFIPFNKNKSDSFSGKIIISTINGKFINGYKVVNGKFVAKYKQKAITKNRLKNHNKAAEPDQEWYDGGELDEITITASGGSSLTFDNNYDPVTSQGWMEPEFSSTDLYSGAGGGSGSGGGGTTTDDGVPVFDCDNPTPTGCIECPNGEVINGVCVLKTEDDILDYTNNDCVGDIIKKLQEKDKFKSLVPDLEGANHLSQTVLDLFGECKNYDLTISISELGNDSQGNPINAQTYGIESITLDDDLVDDATRLSIAKTLIHESMHVFINYNLKTNRTSDLATSIKNYYKKFIKDNPKAIAENLTHHNFMSQYVDALAYSLSAYDNHRQDISYYTKLSWGGLEYSDAYKSKSNSEKSEIQKIINNERYAKSDAKSTKC